MYIYFFTLDFRPFNTTLTKSVNIVYLNTPFNLSCSAQTRPPASYQFYRGQESLGNISVGNTFETSVVQRTSQVNYACTPFNHFGDGQTVVIAVVVYCKYSFWLLWVGAVSLKRPATVRVYLLELENLTASNRTCSIGFHWFGTPVCRRNMAWRDTTSPWFIFSS